MLGLVLGQQHAARRQPPRVSGADVEVEDAVEDGRVDRDYELLSLADAHAAEP
jgi:hypothetical protein